MPKFKCYVNNILQIFAFMLMFMGRIIPFFAFIPNLSLAMGQVLAIFAGALILWLTVAIDWPSLVVFVALAFVPELAFNRLLQQSFGSEIFAFLLCTFILTYALDKSGFIRKIALSFILSPLAAKSVWHFVALYCAAVLCLGAFISPTVLFFIFLPLLKEIYKLLDLQVGNKLASLLMMCTVIMCAISSGMTPIAHAFPLIALGLYRQAYQVEISTLSYTAVVLPACLLLAVLTLLLFRFTYKLDRADWEKLQARHCDLQNNLLTAAGLSREQCLILAVFVFVVCLWIFPLPFSRVFSKTPIPPLIGIILLSLLKNDKGQSVLNVKEAMQKGVAWQSLLMCAATLALGSALTDKELGLSVLFTASLSSVLSGVGATLLVLLFCALTALLTNFSSNMVTVTLMSTLALTVLGQVADVNAAALLSLIGMLSSFAFATPPAMPSVAIAIGSGYTTTKEMLVYGLLVMALAIFVAAFIAYPLANCWL